MTDSYEIFRRLNGLLDKEEEIDKAIEVMKNQINALELEHNAVSVGFTMDAPHQAFEALEGAIHKMEDAQVHLSAYRAKIAEWAIDI